MHEPTLNAKLPIPHQAMNAPGVDARTDHCFTTGLFKMAFHQTVIQAEKSFVLLAAGEPMQETNRFEQFQDMLRKNSPKYPTMCPDDFAVVSRLFFNAWVKHELLCAERLQLRGSVNRQLNDQENHQMALSCNDLRFACKWFDLKFMWGDGKPDAFWLVGTKTGRPYGESGMNYWSLSINKEDDNNG